MATKHTPGPWFVYETASAYNKCDYSIEYRTKVHNNPGFIGKVWGQYEGEANAHLIAAAPEMLEALEDILQRLEDDLFLAGVPREQHKDQRRLKRLYKAIAKARGEV